MRLIFDDNHFSYEKSIHAASDGPAANIFLLTRFNVPLAGARKKGGFEDEERFRQWCANRSKIFTKYCLPSIVSQARKPDAWIILFDEKYNDEVNTALLEIKKYNWIKPIFIGDDFTNIRDQFNKSISRMVNLEIPYTATIRLDNDDALSKLYILATDQYLRGINSSELTDDYWISYPFGVQWDGIDPRLIIQNNNPFLTLVEKTSRYSSLKARTAMSINHGKVFENGHVRIPITRFPMWMQFVHDENVSNTKNDMLLKFKEASEVMRRFGIQLTL